MLLLHHLLGATWWAGKLHRRNAAASCLPAPTASAMRHCEHARALTLPPPLGPMSARSVCCIQGKAGTACNENKRGHASICYTASPNLLGALTIACNELRLPRYVPRARTRR